MLWFFFFFILPFIYIYTLSVLHVPPPPLLPDGRGFVVITLVRNLSRFFFSPDPFPLGVARARRRGNGTRRSSAENPSSRNNTATGPTRRPYCFSRPDYTSTSARRALGETRTDRRRISSWPSGRVTTAVPLHNRRRFRPLCETPWRPPSVDMPLLHRKPFVRNPVPRGLRDTDEVFYCELTKEIFLTYEWVKRATEVAARSSVSGTVCAPPTRSRATRIRRRAVRRLSVTRRAARRRRPRRPIFAAREFHMAPHDRFSRVAHV